MNKKANAAPALTIGFVLFNIIVYIIIIGFAMDDYGQDVGSTVSITSLASSANESGDSTLVTWNDLTFIRKAGYVIAYLPWWLDLFIMGFQAIFIVVIILAWLRGL